MANVYGRISKITNVVGRSEYITDEKRQEEIVLHKKQMLYSWEEHSKFEKLHQKSKVKNNEALEVHFALPNELSQNKEKLEQICDDMVKQIVGNKDFEYAVHWNHNRTNLHCHILFSERENHTELIPKYYKRDIYYNFDEKKLSNKNDKKAEIIHKKGEVQRDKEGNIKYNTDIFKPKDKKYIEKNYVNELRIRTKEVLKSYGYDLGITTDDSPYIAQKKLYKGANSDYIEKASAWNEQVKRYNEGVKQHIELEPEQMENYQEIKKELLSNVKEANSEEKKISVRSIELLSDMVNWVHQTLLQLKTYINRKAKEFDIMSQWEQTKNKFEEMFVNEKENQQELINLKNSVAELKNIEKDYQAVIDSKIDLIQDLEEQNERRRCSELEL